jgi:hypothetical protein
MVADPLKLLALLKSIRLFEGLDEPQLTRLAQAAELIQLEEGQSPTLNKDEDYPFFVIASGNVRLAPLEKDRDEEYVLKKDDFFGADVLFLGERDEYQITALAPATLVAITPERMRILIQTIPRLQANLKAQIRIYRLVRSSNFDWLSEAETVLLIERKHPAYLLVTLLGPLGFAWVAFLGYLFGTQIDTASFRLLVEWLASGGLIIAALWAIWRVIDYYNDFYVVTDERVVWLERVIGIYDSRQETPMEAVKASEAKSNLIGRMLGYGDVITEAIMGKVTFRHVASPNRIKELIDQQHQQALRRQFRNDAGAMEAVIRRKLDPAARPTEPVPLVIIGHPTSDTWLADGFGNLAARLGENNYFVSQTNPGWGPAGVGGRTDILNWPEWFSGPDSKQIYEELLHLRDPRPSYVRTLPEPAGENQLIMLLPGYANSMLKGAPGDPPLPGKSLSIGAAKFVYNSLLEFFQAHPDKLFIVVTAPPVQDSTWADNARAFNTWLVNDWLVQNKYPLNNVVLFDLYNVLTHPDNHHFYNHGSGQVEHMVTYLENTLYYVGDAGLPDRDGSRKATDELVPLLNFFYNRWKAGPSLPPPAVAAPPTGLRLLNYFHTRVEEGDTITYRKHLFILITKTWAPALLGLAAATATVYFLFQSAIGRLTAPTPLTILFLGTLSTLIPALWWLYNFIDWRNDIYRVTSDRIIDSERKPLGDEISKSAPLENILSMDYERFGLLGVLLNFGNVVINVGAENKFIFYNIHDPAGAQADIFNHIIIFRRRKQLTDAHQEWERASDWLAAFYRQSEEMRKNQNSS